MHTNWCVLIEISMEIVLWLIACATVRETHFTREYIFDKESVWYKYIFEITLPDFHMNYKKLGVILENKVFKVLSYQKLVIMKK